MTKNNRGYVETSYNLATAAKYEKEIRKLIKEYYTLVSESAINAFIKNGDFAALTAEELLIRSSFDLALLDKKKQDMADGFIQNIKQQANAKFITGFREAKKPLPKALIQPRKYDRKTKNLITQQVQKITGLETDQYTKIDEALQDNIAKGGTLNDFKESLREAKLYNEKKIKNIAVNQLTYATSLVYKNRAVELGLDDADWEHPKSDIYKTHPRPNHVAASGKRFKLSEGCPIKNEKGVLEYIWPGEKINCKCYYLIVI